MHTCEESWWDGSGEAKNRAFIDMSEQFDVVDDVRNFRGGGEGLAYVTVIFGGVVNGVFWPRCWVIEIAKIQE